MRVIAFSTFRDAQRKYTDCAAQLELLYRDLKNKEFSNLNELKIHFPFVSLLRDNRVVFNVHGNKCRVVVKFNFKMRACFIRFIGTHAEYDKIDANSI